MRIKDIVILSIMSSILIAAKYILSFIPNVELVTLLIILYTLIYKWKALYIIYIFVLSQGLYGFGIWFVNYLYIWTILFLITMLLNKVKSPYIWAIVSGTFGLCFGLLCSIPYLFIGGINMALAYYIEGIPFDLIHGFSNFIIVLVLFKPIYRLLNVLNIKWNQDELPTA